jgi:hypothetical protein
MKEFILLMHNDTVRAESGEEWESYITSLNARGIFDGGSSIGAGACYRKEGIAPDTSNHLVGFIRIRAHDLHGAKESLPGNPVFERGGTVEIRELTTD